MSVGPIPSIWPRIVFTPAQGLFMVAGLSIAALALKCFARRSVQSKALTSSEINSGGMAKCLETCKRLGLTAPQKLILVDSSRQTAYLYSRGKKVRFYPVSTAEKGTGQIENSSQTPLGLHLIDGRIGDGAGLRAIFESRVDTGRVFKEGDFSKNYITTRILRIRGLETGFNREKNGQGQVVDSFDRYIYFHGTNRVDQLGTPTSAGCIRMKPEDVIELFNRVPEKTMVYIC